jgi:hypothetical protein
MNRAFYLALTVAFILFAVGLELHQRLNGHPFSVTQLALSTVHHEHLIAASMALSLFFSVKFAVSQ